MNTKIVSMLVLLSVSAIAPLASAQEPMPPPAPSDAGALRFELGTRQAFIANPGLDAFARHNEFGQLSLALSRVVLARGRLAFAPGVAWDYGETDADVRGSPSALVVHRLSVPLEGRYSILPRLYAYARVAPGAAAVHGEVHDTSSPGTLVRSAWLPSLDASAGASYRVLTIAEVHDRPLDVWLAAEGGYGGTRSTDLTMTPDLADGDPRRTGAVDLGSLALRGAFVRAAIALTF